MEDIQRKALHVHARPLPPCWQHHRHFVPLYLQLRALQVEIGKAGSYVEIYNLWYGGASASLLSGKCPKLRGPWGHNAQPLLRPFFLLLAFLDLPTATGVAS